MCSLVVDAHWSSIQICARKNAKIHTGSSAHRGDTINTVDPEINVSIEIFAIKMGDYFEHVHLFCWTE